MATSDRAVDGTGNVLKGMRVVTSGLATTTSAESSRPQAPVDGTGNVKVVMSGR
jgi:hypothetical protein